MSSLIRGEPPADPSLADPDFRKRLMDAADFHGVRPLMAHRLRQSQSANENIQELAEICAEYERSDAATGLIKEKELTNTIDALTNRGVFPLLIKGAPLAYSHYPSPETRPRADTDILIPLDARPSVGTILQELGYRLPEAASNQSIHYQFSAEKRDQFGVDHFLDVHWKLSNHKAFAGLFSYDELARASVPVPDLGVNARTLGPAHALLLACMHRVAHIHAPLYIDGIPHYGGDRLIWIYDIHLLMTQMSQSQLEEFVALAIENRISAVCLDGIKSADYHFGTTLPKSLMESLSEIGAAEPSARCLVPDRLRHLLTELDSLSDWHARVRYLKELAFPRSVYLLQKYEVSSRLWLPLLYLHRGLRGLWELARHTDRGRPSGAGRTMPAERFE
ncbi:MAG: nucleotidyltransferase family protein [Gammaproteobacteria bacterium]|nr:nucleotidyltransferase family protein [Gammaproteobacteria bacterium]MDH3412001.1 nucleotidyltransferase family protein [Gammaproteobacteria bacterium]